MGRRKSDGPSDLDVKAAVRERDGYKCRDCGMTAEQHQEKYGETLHVHRLFPGFTYVAYWCVTLCIPCHGKKPKCIGDVVDDDHQDLKHVSLNMYNSDHRWIWEQLERAAALEGIPPFCKAWLILNDHFRANPNPPDYVI